MRPTWCSCTADIEKHPRKESYSFTLNLSLPTGTLHATGEGPTSATASKRPSPKSKRRSRNTWPCSAKTTNGSANGHARKRWPEVLKQPRASCSVWDCGSPVHPMDPKKCCAGVLLNSAAGVFDFAPIRRVVWNADIALFFRAHPDSGSDVPRIRSITRACRCIGVSPAIFPMPASTGACALSLFRVRCCDSFVGA